jgi:hypothetical protein
LNAILTDDERTALIAPIPRKNRKSVKSPTARSLAEMRGRGYLCDVVERRVQRTMITRDLYGFIDILCVKGEDIIGVQTTSSSNMADRLTKITEHPNWPIVCAAIRIVVHGWRKNAAGKWVLREHEL